MNILLVTKQHALKVDLERQQARIALETGTDVQPHPSTRLPGDPRQLRGIPCLGIKGGCSSAIPHTRPDTEANAGRFD